MERLVEKVNHSLSHAFPPPSKVELRNEDGIIGIVTSPRFNGKDDFARQRLLWKPLSNLSNAERRRVVILVGLTPEEDFAHMSSFED